MKSHLTPYTLTAAFTALTLIAIVVGLVIDRAIQRRRLRTAVYGNLDAAWDSDHFFAPGGYLCDMTPGEVAYDLSCYAPDLELERPETLLPYVNEWIDKHKHSLKVRGAECVKDFLE